MAERRVLAGDIGGTKTYLALFSLDSGQLRLERRAAFTNAGFSGAEAVLDEFMAGQGGRVDAAALGVACPVVSGRCVLTNLGWTVDAAALGARLGLREAALVNDLAAIGWGLPLLSPTDFHVLQQGSPLTGNAALIAAGTGLGETILFWDGSAHLPSASEGGHTDFGPRNELESELLSFLMARWGHVSYERVVSGPGLEAVYEFMVARAGKAPDKRLSERFRAEGMAQVVSDEAIGGSDALCKASLELFVSVYGAEAGNLALKALATAGVYVGGGIAPKILKALSGGLFMDAFRDKGRFGELMSRMPVRVILNDMAGLIGAANLAASVASGNKASSVVMDGAG